MDSTNSFNNNQNSIISIVNEVLGEEAQEHIVKKIASEVTAYYATLDEKLDELLKNKAFNDALMIQITEATKTNSSLTGLLEKAHKERENALVELKKIKQEASNRHDVEFNSMLEQAEEALSNYNSKAYREILERYREKDEHKKRVQNIAKIHY